MKKTFNALRWTVINCLFLWAVIAATIYGNQNAGNIVIFLTVFLAVGAFLASKNQKLIKSRAIKGFSVNGHLDIAFDLVVIGVLIWHAWWFTGVMFLIHVGYAQVFRDNVEKRIDEMEEYKKCRTPYPIIET